jgi:hypothetical protein
MACWHIVCEQGSPEWFAARLGIPTASCFSTVMAKGKDKKAPSMGRRTYMDKLAGEIITGEPMASFSNGDTERGHEQEDDGRRLYAFERDVDPERVGFFRNSMAGCSPDALLGGEGGLEIKCALAHVQIERLRAGRIPPEHVAQVQGCLWITDREWWDFVSYSPKLPLLIVRVPRDEVYIANLVVEVSRFNEELRATVDWLRRYGEDAANPSSYLVEQLKASVEAL